MPSGRARQFDIEEALDKAMEVFWKRGYEGATLGELTEAMGINRPSLYAAFGNKEELFRKVLDRYGSGPVAYMAEALREPTARRVVEKMFRGAMRMLGDNCSPRGGLVVHGALTGGKETECIRKELAVRRESGVAAIRERFERAAREGDLPRETNCTALARYIATVLHGLSVEALSGATKPELESVVELAMKAWPGEP